MKRAFTLVEILISVGLLSILIMFMYKTLETMKKSNTLYERHYSKLMINTKIHKTMFLDFVQSDKVDIKSGDFDRIVMRSKNSHFHIAHPYISYLVKENVLYRIESDKNIGLNIKYDLLKYIKFEVVKKNIKKFKIFKGKNSFLINLDNLIFEVEK